jgi:putative membrane protein insertion efficiency factor
MTPVGRGLALLIRLYQRTFSVVLGPRCRFYPTCSQYARECLERYPLRVAGLKTAGRLLRCHPFHPGGLDLP